MVRIVQAGFLIVLVVLWIDLHPFDGLCQAFRLNGSSSSQSKSQTSLRRKAKFHQKASQQQLGEFEQLSFDRHAQDLRLVKVHDWSRRSPIPFQQAWEIQREVLDAHLNRIEQQERSQFSMQKGGDQIIMLQHTPVYTLGTGSAEKNILTNSNDVDVVRMDRGGEVTYHGPGQLVVYPILDLRGGYKQDIHWYMRALEEAILNSLKRAGIEEAERQDGLTGIWVNDHKVAAIGIKCRRWITQHGLAVNVEKKSLENFKGIVPCGLSGRKVGCVNMFTQNELTVPEFAAHMKEALSDTFQIELVNEEGCV